MRPSWDGLRRSFIAQRERVSDALSDALATTSLGSGTRENDANGRIQTNLDGDVAEAESERLYGSGTSRTRQFLRRIARRDGGNGTSRKVSEEFRARYESESETESAGTSAAERSVLATCARAELTNVGSGRVFVAMRVIGERGIARGRRVRTSCRGKTKTPVWNATRDLRCDASDRDALCVDVYLGQSVKGIEKASLIARGQISMAFAFANEGREVPVPLHTKLERAGAVGTVWIRVTRTGALQGSRKRIFFVRHGESKWNEAQRDINFASMMKFDHPLTLVGVQQSQALGERAAIACSHGRAGILVNANVSSMSPPTLSPPSSPPPSSPFRSTSQVTEHQYSAQGAELCASYEECETCYVSPLTRTVQTSCLLLQSHPNTFIGKMHQVCLQSLREIKGVGGLDTVGIEQGDAILERARKKLAELVNDGGHSASRLSSGIAFDSNDAVGQWWTSETDSDNSQDVDERMFDFLEAMRFDEDEAVIVVGHSLFLQQLISRIVPTGDVDESLNTGSVAANLLDGFSDPFAPKDPFEAFATNSNSGDIPFVPAQAPPVVATIEPSRSRMKIFERLMSEKLCNAGCVALDVNFDDSGRATLEDAQLIFGSKFV